MTTWNKLIDGFHKNGISTFDDVPTEMINWIKENGEASRKNKNTYNHNLIGHMKEEYQLNNIPSHVYDYIIKGAFVEPFYDTWKDMSLLTHNVPVTLSSLWINYQRKHEFNPIHDHGGFASFIIFINIPYDIENEEKYFSGFNKDSVIHTSKLSFYNTTHQGKLDSLIVPVDKSFEGKMIMFSAKHHHEVYPFYTSDDYRITVSGNLKFDTSLYKDFFNDK